MGAMPLYESIDGFLMLALACYILACCVVHCGDIAGVECARECLHTTARGLKRGERFFLFMAGIVIVTCSLFSYGDFTELGPQLAIACIIVIALVGALLAWYAFNGSVMGDREPLCDCDNGGLQETSTDADERTQKLLGTLEEREQTRATIRGCCRSCCGCIKACLCFIPVFCKRIWYCIVGAERMISDLPAANAAHAREADGDDFVYLRVEP